jgi:hypothetical protein
VGHGGSDRGRVDRVALWVKDRVSVDGGSSNVDLLIAVDVVPGISATTIAKTSSRRAAASGPTAGVWGGQVRQRRTRRAR